MIKVLREYEKDGISITEYTKDGTAVSHTVKTPIQTEPTEPQEPSIEQEILFEMRYQTRLLEMGGMM